MPHTSDDDHLRYRSQEELDLENNSDPLPKFQDILVSCGILNEESCQTLIEAVNQEVENAITEADAAPFPDPESAFTGIYSP